MPNRDVEPWIRYAIYLVPAANLALYRFGSFILGYDWVHWQRCAITPAP
jgi:hypothetical protein